VNPTLKRLDDELARLQGKQVSLENPAQEQRRKEAAHRREHLEENNRRRLDAIEPVRVRAEQLQQRIEAMRKGAAPDTSPRHDQLLRGLEHELANTLKQYEGMVKAAKEALAWSKPRIEWCRHVEEGRATEIDADIEAGLAELENGGAK
jgi:hypothetical protein